MCFIDVLSFFSEVTLMGSFFDRYFLPQTIFTYTGRILVNGKLQFLWWCCISKLGRPRPRAQILITVL